jgi:histidine triad (HIT) family protein
VSKEKNEKYKNCTFCSRDEFAIIAKNGDAVAIICDTAKNWGHSMIIPFEHSSNLASGMKEKIWQKGIIPLLREVIEKFKKNPQVIGFHINSNAGWEAEQRVFHTHIHVVPIYQKDKGNWINFFNKEFTGPGITKIDGWDNSYQQIQDHIKYCLEKKFLKDNKKDKFEDFPVWHFNLFAYIGNGSLDNQEHFWIVPKTGASSYHWGGGVNCKTYNFQERGKISEKIKNEKWEEESTEKPSTPKKDKPTKNNDNQQPNQNGTNHNQNMPPPGSENGKGQNGESKRPRNKGQESGRRKEKPGEWRENLKAAGASFGEPFTDEKITEWQQEKGEFNTSGGVKKMLLGVKDNLAFLAEIRAKHSTDSLRTLITNKTPREVIMIVKRFEYENLNSNDKEIKNKKIKKYYNLKETSPLTDNQINEFCYRVAIGEINENSIKLDENQQKIIKPQENNLSKIVGISALVLVFFSFLLLLFIKKRKEKLNR